MPEKTFKLEAIEFRESPTKSQFANSLGEIHKFLSKSVGSMLASGEFGVDDPNIVASLNAVGALIGAQKQWDGQSGLAVPQPQQPRPQMVR